MKIILIRHGETIEDLKNEYEKTVSHSLSPKGFEQVKKMSKKVNSLFSIDHIFSSDSLHTEQTAIILAKEVFIYDNHKNVTYEKGIQGWNFKTQNNLNHHANNKHHTFPKKLRPNYESIEDGESEIEFRSRIEITFRKILNASELKNYNTIAIISHHETINKIFESFLELPFSSNLSFFTNEGAFHCIEFNNTQKIIHFANEKPY